MEKNNLEIIKENILKIVPAIAIYLFGSYAKGTADKNSDFDICVISEARNKRNLLTELYCNIESEKPVDILLYTPLEWAKCVDDITSFAYKINNEGVVLYAR